MSKLAKALTLTAGLLVLGAAASNAFIHPTPPAPPAAADEGGIGPDVIVGSLFDTNLYGRLDNKHAFSVGTESCNIGDENVDWIANNNRHPVIAQNMYRLQGGRIVQIGMSWLKHGFAALNNSLCQSCNPTSSNNLGVGCSDPYTAGLNGSQGNLGPRSEVNAFNGVYPYPYGGDNANDLLDKRIVVETSDLNPANFPGASYFVEGHYITQDDAQAGNGANNASYRPINVTGSNPNFNISLTGTTHRMQPAILAWSDANPNVHVAKVTVPNEGILYLLSNVTDNGDGTWHYEYALFNVNSDRSVRGFGVPIPSGVNIGGLGKIIPSYYEDAQFDGEPYTDYNWKTGVKQGYRYWATKPYNADPLANPIRWSAMANFWFDADQPPMNVDCGVEMFKPGNIGDPKRVFFNCQGPSAP